MSESGRYIMDTLHPFGIDVQTADSGEMAVHMAEQAVEAGKTKTWDVVIIDWKMPNGWCYYSRKIASDSGRKQYYCFLPMIVRR